MDELVQLPSGSTAPLVAPSFVSLLCCDGSLEGLAGCVFAHAEVDVSYLSPDDLYAVAEWAVQEFTQGGKAAALAEVCEAYGERPSRRVRITDPMLAFALDHGCLAALVEARAPRGGQEEPHEDLEERLRRQAAEDEREEAVRFTTPDPAAAG